MVRLTRIYTRGGDAGKTSVGSGIRVPKHSLRISAIGEVDETNATVGLARLHLAGHADAGLMLARIQDDLFDLGADLASPGEDFESASALRITEAQVRRIESEIDTTNAGLPPLDSFILPGGTLAATQLHVARTVSRRAERTMTVLAVEEPVNPAGLRYINRISDLFFVLSRSLNAARKALSSPLLEASIEGARGVLLNITGPSDLGILEVNEAAEVIHGVAHPDANIIFGTVVDEEMGDDVRVTVIAAGFDRWDDERARPLLRGFLRAGTSEEEEELIADVFAEDIEDDGLDVPNFLR